MVFVFDAIKQHVSDETRPGGKLSRMKTGPGRKLVPDEATIKTTNSLHDFVLFEAIQKRVLTKTVPDENCPERKLVPDENRSQARWTTKETKSLRDFDLCCNNKTSRTKTVPDENRTGVNAYALSHLCSGILDQWFHTHTPNLYVSTPVRRG